MELSYSSTLGKQQSTTYNLIMSNPIVIWNNNAIPSLIMLFRNTLLSVKLRNLIVLGNLMVLGRCRCRHLV